MGVCPFYTGWYFREKQEVFVFCFPDDAKRLTVGFHTGGAKRQVSCGNQIWKDVNKLVDPGS
jgi:hypothetical protein